METKHTPGPWRIGESNSWNILASDGLVASATFAHGFTADFRQRETVEANAQLMAAAPDLLAACELSLRNAESLIYQSPAKIEDSVELKSLRTWRDQLKAAIAKATGGAE